MLILVTDLRRGNQLKNRGLLQMPLQVKFDKFNITTLAIRIMEWPI